MLRERAFDRQRWLTAALCVAMAMIVVAQTAFAAEPLASWNDTAPRKAIIAFVERATKQGSPDFVPPDQRIATFDNDGTLWCEMPMYVQEQFVFDRVHAMAPQHPEWKNQEPFAALLRDDLQAVAATGEKGLLELVTVTHAGMTVEEFSQSVSDWIAVAKHPRFHRLYTRLIYQPMLELLDYLRANGFKTYIVSGGGIEFMRPWTEKTYGIPPEQVVGSYGQLAWEMENGAPILRKLPKVSLIDDKQGKPVGIQTFIGRRPVMAFGNSDGDLEMLEWTTAGTGPRFGMIVHHTDAVREYAYDRQSRVGRLDRALDAAPARGWVVVSMKSDWKMIFPEEY